MHALIIGTTGSGKSTLAKLLCRTLKKQGQICAVLSPTNETGWEADYKTSDGGAFLAYAREHEKCFLFVDESGDAIGRYNDEMNWLATGSRHKGHSVIFNVQASSQISTAIRSCCSDAYIFATSRGVLKLLSEDFNETEILKHDKMPRYHFLMVSRFAAIRMGRLDNGGASCYIGKLSEFSPQKQGKSDEPTDDDKRDDPIDGSVSTAGDSDRV